MHNLKYQYIAFSLLLLFYLTTSCLPIWAQDVTSQENAQLSNTDQDDCKEIVKIRSELVLIDVSIIDKNNRFVTGIDRGKFQVFENQAAQKIDFFSQEQVPISYGIVVDTSGSMRARLSTVIKAAQTLIDLSRPGDEVFIVDMKDSRRIELIKDFTKDFASAKEALDNMVAGGGTALLDGIFVAGEHAKRGMHRRKALVVISDGDERDSSFTINETLDRLRELDVQLYMIGFPDDLGDGSVLFRRSPKKRAVYLINKLTSESGGQCYFPKDLKELEQIGEKIASDLRSQYIIGYHPNNQKLDGGFRRIQVKLVDNKDHYAVRTRSGYYATTD